jgi:phosphoribosylglycinamide formyltransferase 1
MTRIGILIGPKGRGSNMAALIRASREGRIPAEVAVVVSPVTESPATALARESGVMVAVVPPGEEYGPRLLDALTDCDLLCLAGFLRLLPSEVLEKFDRRVLNVHPSLLPKFGGKGMYGMHVHRAVLEARETESGCTVHIVGDEYDEGPIVLQMKCDVLPDDTPETLAARVLALEHEAFPAAVAKVLGGS